MVKDRGRGVPDPPRSPRRSPPARRPPGHPTRRRGRCDRCAYYI